VSKESYAKLRTELGMPPATQEEEAYCYEQIHKWDSKADLVDMLITERASVRKELEAEVQRVSQIAAGTIERCQGYDSVFQLVIAMNGDTMENHATPWSYLRTRFIAMQEQTTKLMERVVNLLDEQGRLNAKCQTYENSYILPVFQWAKGLGMNLEQVVKENPGKNCVELFFNALVAGHVPFRIVLFCPHCHKQHVDRGDWVTRPHSTHRCVSEPGDGETPGTPGCGKRWRPSDYPTVGVARLQDTGFGVAP
jgi:hypothetical protein